MALILAAIAASCTPRTVYMPLQTVRTVDRQADTALIKQYIRQISQTTRQNQSQQHNTTDRQTETITLNQNGDTTRHNITRTVFIETTRITELEHIVARQDSAIESLRQQLTTQRTDSTNTPYPVAKPLSRWQQIKLDIFPYALGIIVAILFTAVAGIIKKLRI